MEDNEYENDVDYEEEAVDNVTDDEKTDDYLNEILTESQEFKEEPEEFEKNEEGVTGDEWKDEEKEKLLKEIKEENKRNAERRIRNKKKQAATDEGEDSSEQEERLEDDDLDAAELEQFRERTQQLEERMNIAAPVMDYLVQNRIGQNELKLGVDFVNNDTLYHLKAYRVSLLDNSFRLSVHSEIKYVSKEELLTLEMVPSDLMLINKLIGKGII